MSEYQFVDFIAIDGPVSEKNLAFMEKQSTRAEISPWRFTNEYHFGDFRGDASAMLHRGYDMHLHYANFGIRKIMIRLPKGLPWDKRVFARYAVDHDFTWQKDRGGTGGILKIEPEGDADSFDDVPDLDNMLEALVPVRESLIGGDLRPLFLGWLACCNEREASVPPVPAGMKKLTEPLAALADFFSLPKAMLRKAVRNSLPAPEEPAESPAMEKWIARQSKADLKKIVAELLGEDSLAAKSQYISEIRSGEEPRTWPTTPSNGTFGDLCRDKL